MVKGYVALVLEESLLLGGFVEVLLVEAEFLSEGGRTM